MPFPTCSCGEMLDPLTAENHECFSVGDRVVTPADIPTLANCSGIIFAEVRIPKYERGTIRRIESDQWDSLITWVEFDNCEPAWVRCAHIRGLGALDQIVEAIDDLDLRNV